MSRGVNPVAESRQCPRLKLPAAYTLLRVRPHGEKRYRHIGYIYDISASGMRFELDLPVAAGQTLDIKAMLPGSFTTTFRATGKVVRTHDDPHEPGPVRMAMTFDRFTDQHDREQLHEYLSQSGLRLAA